MEGGGVGEGGVGIRTNRSRHMPHHQYKQHPTITNSPSIMPRWRTVAVTSTEADPFHHKMCTQLMDPPHMVGHTDPGIRNSNNHITLAEEGGRVEDSGADGVKVFKATRMEGGLGAKGTRRIGRGHIHRMIREDDDVGTDYSGCFIPSMSIHEVYDFFSCCVPNAHLRCPYLNFATKWIC